MSNFGKKSEQYNLLEAELHSANASRSNALDEAIRLTDELADINAVTSATAIDLAWAIAEINLLEAELRSVRSSRSSALAEVIRLTKELAAARKLIMIYKLRDPGPSIYNKYKKLTKQN